MSTPPILLLDYDGVLHGWLVRRNRDGLPVLDSAVPGARLFMWAPILDAVLKDFPDVRIVLSTTWVPVFGYEVAVACLPQGLRERVVGATFDEVTKNYGYTASEWRALSRWMQICRWIEWKRPNAWIALDDTLDDCPQEMKSNVVMLNPERGLSQPEKVERLRMLLEGFS